MEDEEYNNNRTSAIQNIVGLDGKPPLGDGCGMNALSHSLGQRHKLIRH